MVALTVVPLSNFVFEVNDASGSSSDMSGSVIKNYQITVNRFHSSQTSTSTDIVTSKYLTANLDGSLPKTQVSIDTTGVTDMNAYFDACFSIVVTPFNSNQTVVSNPGPQTVITKYVLPPTASDFGPVSIASEQSRIIIDASLTDASFNPAGLQYLIQIDGIDSSGTYLSRNEYVGADASFHNLFFDTSGASLYGESGLKRLINTKFYDVTVIALNTTGSVTLKNETIRVDEHANPPTISITNKDEYNFIGSEGKILLKIQGIDVTNDPDQEYKLTVAEFDTSNVPLSGYPKTIVAGKDVSGNFDASVDVSYLITGLTANTKYVLTATAANSTAVHSLVSNKLSITPQSLPSGLKITEIRRGLNASETDPSGRLLVFLDSAAFLPNGIDVSLNYKIKSFTDSEAVTDTAEQKLYALLNNPDASAAIVFKEAFYDLCNNLVPSGTAFDISGLTNNKHQLVAVFAQNRGISASDLSASWVGVGVSPNTSGSGDNAVILNATNAPKPITHPDAPTITGTHPVEFEKSKLASGEISVTIKLPVNNYEYDSSASDGVNNIPDYASYKIMIEDMSGSDISNVVVTLDPSYDYLETGKLFKFSSTGSASNIDGSSVIVSDSSDGLIGLYQNTTANRPSKTNPPGVDNYSGYQLDPSWVEFGRVTWVDGSGANRMRDDASFTAVFSGLENGKRYRAKAQVTLDSMESSIIDEQEKIVPSKKPELSSSVANLIPGIFDVSAGTILDGSLNTSYDASGIEEILVGADNGGYDISGIAVVFVFQYTTNGNTVNRVDRIFNVGINGGLADMSGGITDTKTLAGTSLTSQKLDTSKVYNVFIVPQNAVYYDGVTFDSFLDISNLAGTIMLTGLELDSAILDISSVKFEIDPLDSTKIKVTGQIQVAVNGEYTVLKRLDGSLTRKGKYWDAQSKKLETVTTDASHVVVPFTIEASELDASSNFSTEFTTTATHYGWDHTVEIAAISRPKGDASSSVEYKQTAKSNADALIPGKRPTVILDPTVDASNKQIVEVLPNGSTTVVTLIDLSGNALATIDPIPGGSGNDTGAMNTIVNTFYNASGILVSLDSTVDGGVLPATGSDVSGLYNTFKIDASLNLQASAHNAHGRTTLFSEKTFKLVVVSGSASVVPDASNDGIYTLSVGGNTVQLKLDLKENDYGNA